jgi:uncharacterized protein (TIGR02466 family)
MQYAQLFSTPIALFEPPGLEALNKEMTEILVAESETVASVAVSNVGGWHSRFDLHKRPQSCFRTLSDIVVASAQELTETLAKAAGSPFPKMIGTTEMWAMVMRHGDYTIAHTHAVNHWAAVYYPDVGDADQKTYPKSGTITFVDPRLGFVPVPGLDMVVANFEINAKPGQLLMFPGWLMHYVHAYKGLRPRVSIACNVHFEVVAA